MIRLAHLSDIHVTAARLEWRLRDWFSKRYPGWINYRWLGRRYRFRQADEVLGVLGEELRRGQFDRLIFSGDATAMGFESEFRRAAELLHVGDPAMPRGLAVPGNHDYYTRHVAASGLFECYFKFWQEGQRVDGSLYPFAQRVGHVWLVGVNSCTGNVWPWDAAGSAGSQQRQRLARLLAGLSTGPRILVTHYPVCLATGEKEPRTHNLRDAEELVRVAAEGGVSLWLHGHRHGAYFVEQPSLAPFPVVCAGSATQSRRWSFGVYTIDGLDFRATRRIYSAQDGLFVDGPSFSLRLRE
jgi:3',5'-cyclic AMP phosphodiesterase CpdA